MDQVQNLGDGKSPGKKIFAILAAIVLAAVGIGTYAYYTYGVTSEETPPSLTMDTSAYMQGKLSTINGFAELRTKSDDVCPAGESISLNKNVNHLFSTDPVSMKDVADALKFSGDDGQYLVAFFSPGGERAVTQSAKFKDDQNTYYLYPTERSPLVLDEESAKYFSLENLDEAKGNNFLIPAYRGFQIVVNNSTTQLCTDKFNFVSSSNKTNVWKSISKADFLDKVEYWPQGWVMIPMMYDQDSIKAFGEVIPVNSVSSLFVQNGNNKFISNISYVESGASTLPEYVMVWVKLRAGITLDEDAWGKFKDALDGKVVTPVVSISSFTYDADQKKITVGFDKDVKADDESKLAVYVRKQGETTISSFTPGMISVSGKSAVVSLPTALQPGYYLLNGVRGVVGLEGEVVGTFQPGSLQFTVKTADGELPPAGEFTITSASYDVVSTTATINFSDDVKFKIDDVAATATVLYYDVNHLDCGDAGKCEFIGTVSLDDANRKSIKVLFDDDLRVDHKYFVSALTNVVRAADNAEIDFTKSAWIGEFDHNSEVFPNTNQVSNFTYELNENNQAMIAMNFSNQLSDDIQNLSSASTYFTLEVKDGDGVDLISNSEKKWSLYTGFGSSKRVVIQRTGGLPNGTYVLTIRDNFKDVIDSSVINPENEFIITGSSIPDGEFGLKEVAAVSSARIDDFVYQDDAKTLWVDFSVDLMTPGNGAYGNPFFAFKLEDGSTVNSGDVEVVGGDARVEILPTKTGIHTYTLAGFYFLRDIDGKDIIFASTEGVDGRTFDVEVAGCLDTGLQLHVVGDVYKYVHVADDGSLHYMEDTCLADFSWSSVEVDPPSMPSWDGESDVVKSAFASEINPENFTVKVRVRFDYGALMSMMKYYPTEEDLLSLFRLKFGAFTIAPTDGLECDSDIDSSCSSNISDGVDSYFVFTDNSLPNDWTEDLYSGATLEVNSLKIDDASDVMHIINQVYSVDMPA